MEMELTAYTELDAVNSIIGTIGESPIDTLDDLSNVDAINALRILRDNSRREQARGWSFNIIPEFTLNPEASTGKIPWNSNYLSLKGLNEEKLVRKDNYVIDLASDTREFSSPITAEAVILMPFDELPEAMRNYIIAKASFQFQSRYFGDDSMAKITQAEVQEAWQYLQEYELDNNDYCLLDNAHIQELLSR